MNISEYPTIKNSWNLKTRNQINSTYAPAESNWYFKVYYLPIYVSKKNFSKDLGMIFQAIFIIVQAVLLKSSKNSN